MYHPQSELILRSQLRNTLASSLHQLDQTNPVNNLDAAYRVGFRAALATVALAYGLNMPELREAQATARRESTAVTRHDGRI